MGETISNFNVSGAHPACNTSQSSYAFPDKVTLLARHPAPKQSIEQLPTLNLQPRSPHHSAQRWRGYYQQRIKLFQPSRSTFEQLHDLIGDEFAGDHIFRNDDDSQRAFDYLHAHYVKDRHSKLTVKIVKSTTRYTGSKWSPNQLVMYADRVCKLTGETSCLHLEWRVRGVRAIERLGIVTIEDLLQFDHQQLWRERLKVYEPDIARVGRAYWNWHYGERRRQPWRSKWFDFDEMMGRRLMRFAGGTVQGLVDRHARFFNIRVALTPVYLEQNSARFQA